MSDQPVRVTYAPEVFDAGSMEYARAIILTGEGSTTDERWRTETPYLCDLMGSALALTRDMIVVDYGCGVGRLSKALIERYGCRVVGVDISAKMRALAIDYVGSDRFFACPPEMLTGLAERGFRADAAFSVWVLQHCLNPRDDVGRLHRALRNGGRFFILNNTNRRVPTREAAWVDDGLDIRALLGEFFTLREHGIPADHVTPSNLRNVVFWGCYQKPG